SIEHLHEWRKRSKDLRYALDLLEPTWPPVVKALADEVHALTDRLGDDQDLSRLDRVLRDEPASFGTPEDRAPLRGLTTVRRDALSCRRKPGASANDSTARSRRRSSSVSGGTGRRGECSAAADPRPFGAVPGRQRPPPRAIVCRRALPVAPRGQCSLGRLRVPG